MNMTRIEGLRTHRHKRNPLEKRMHDGFVDMGEERMSNILGETPSPRDIAVMATTVQWLGSPVGQDFLSKYGPYADTETAAEPKEVVYKIKPHTFIEKIIRAFKNRIQ